LSGGSSFSPKNPKKLLLLLLLLLFFLKFKSQQNLVGKEKESSQPLENWTQQQQNTRGKIIVSIHKTQGLSIFSFFLKIVSL
jgi:hypothetical protein